jgi:hypothetical protein
VVELVGGSKNPNSPEPERAESGQNTAATRRSFGGEFWRQEHLGEGSVGRGERGEEGGASPANDGGGCGRQRQETAGAAARSRARERRITILVSVRGERLECGDG